MTQLNIVRVLRGQIPKCFCNVRAAKQKFRYDGDVVDVWVCSVRYPNGVYSSHPLQPGCELRLLVEE